MIIRSDVFICQENWESESRYEINACYAKNCGCLLPKRQRVIFKSYEFELHLCQGQISKKQIR